MLSKNEAWDIARNHLLEIEKEIKIDLEFSSDSPMKVNYGYIFSYNSAEFFKTNDFREALAGNAPFLVDIFDNKIVTFGTADTIDNYLKEYEKCKQA
ncbi:YrhB domain-containing protein [Psychrobacter sp. I-STPA6b]|uniref:YrhB domain-containing protein n=1 Tax=Psychrobacter sp. I-STPA6b TaxID=2585718 RepID=UPI001D0C2500|nr:YrhB domain-containing protein [Psychrobacter sp. I-STPA6b]